MVEDERAGRLSAGQGAVVGGVVGRFGLRYFRHKRAHMGDGPFLGWALALQLALFAAKRRPRKAHEVRVTTFGEPPIGDRRFFDAQRRRHPRLARRYDRRVAVAAPPGCRPDIVPATTRLVGGGSSAHFAEPRHACAADPPGNVVAAHAMVGYWRALMDGLRRDFALETLYEGPGFWGLRDF